MYRENDYLGLSLQSSKPRYKWVYGEWRLRAHSGPNLDSYPMVLNREMWDRCRRMDKISELFGVTQRLRPGQIQKWAGITGEVQ